MGSKTHRIVVVLDGATHEIDILEGETIFRAALRHGLAPPFSCVSGYCGECVATLEQGEVEMGENRALSPKQLARGEILTCQAKTRRGPCRVRFGRSLT